MSRPSRIERVCWVILIVGVLNGFACAAISSAVGGDGWQGHIEGERYYVGSHGVYTEVSRATFIYTKVHLVVFVVLLTVALFAGLLAALLRDHRESEE